MLFEFLRPLGGRATTHGQDHAVRRQRADDAARHGRLRVPALHRDFDDPEGRGRLQLRLARRAAAQPGRAPQRNTWSSCSSARSWRRRAGVCWRRSRPASSWPALRASPRARRGLARHIAPYLLIIGLFAFVYILHAEHAGALCNSAFVGALFGGVLWAAVGALFARIVVYSAKTAAIYAGFAIVLLFLHLAVHQLADPVARRAAVVLRAAPRAPAHGPLATSR